MQRSILFMIPTFSVRGTPMVAQQGGQRTEIEILKGGVAELERQIHTILESLAEQNKRAEAPTGSASPVASVSVKQRATSNSQAPPAKQQATSGRVGSASDVDVLTAVTLKPYGLLRLDVDVDSQRPNLIPQEIIDVRTRPYGSFKTRRAIGG